MQVKKYSDKEAWLEGRRGRIGSSRLGSMFSKRDKKPLKPFYEVIAERVAIPETDENKMDRGHRLEDEAIKRFNEVTGKNAVQELEIWTRDDNEYISASPDATIGETEAVELKCRDSAYHIESWLKREVPKEYHEQSIQYFIVNEKLETLYFTFYDPRMPKDLFYITINRADIADQIAEYTALQLQALAEIEDIISQLTF